MKRFTEKEKKILFFMEFVFTSRIKLSHSGRIKTFETLMVTANIFRLTIDRSLIPTNNLKQQITIFWGGLIIGQNHHKTNTSPPHWDCLQLAQFRAITPGKQVAKIVRLSKVLTFTGSQYC